MKNLTLCLVVLCISCSTPSVLVKKNADIQRLGLYFEPGEHSIPLIAQQFDDDLDRFIIQHNTKPGRKFELYRASPMDSSSLRIKLIGTQLVSPGEQTAGAFVSLIGLSLPFILISSGSPFYVGFYYFPKAKSLTELSLSQDIDGSLHPKREFLLTSPGFLMSPEKQIEKHVYSFGRMLALLVSQIERQSATKKVNNYARQ
ncbi:MAG TPA: hypothetical protein VFO54_06235 [Chryseosolibacter sp.]|nr:hypothetical protein [Chryseosolibacter sp.]